MIKILFNIKKWISLLIIIFLSILTSNCSDFKQAIGKEKYIPNEYSFINTPRLILPPEFGSSNNIVEKVKEKNNQDIIFENKSISSQFDELFDFQSIPKNIRKLVDDETLGISRSERTGMDILTGNNPKIGVFLDSEKETIRIKKNKGNSLIKKPSPSINTIDGNKLLIK